MNLKIGVVLVCAAVLACDSSPRPPVQDTLTFVSPAADVGTPASTPSVAQVPVVNQCPHNGKWALCSVERRLKQSGFVVKKVDSAVANRAGFSVKPTVYSLGQTRLEVFLYADSTAMKKDFAKLDTVVVGPRGTKTQWGEISPVLVRSANLAGVILSLNPRQLERAMLSLTAGPPQPGSPR